MKTGSSKSKKMLMNLNALLSKLRRLGLDRLFAFINVVVTFVVAFVVGRAAPETLPVEIGSIVVSTFLLVSAVGLALRARWAGAVTRVAAAVLLVAGLAATAALVLGMVFTRAVSAVDSPGPLLFGLVLLALVPQSIVYPLLLLCWLPRGRAAPR
jgi:hypothetical protein